MFYYMFDSYLASNFHGIITAAIIYQHHFIHNIKRNFLVGNFKRLTGIIGRKYNNNLFSVYHNNLIFIFSFLKYWLKTSSLFILFQFKIIKPNWLITVIPKIQFNFLFFKSIRNSECQSDLTPAHFVFLNCITTAFVKKIRI